MTIESAEFKFISGDRESAISLAKKHLAEGGEPDRALMLIGLCELSRTPSTAAKVLSLVSETSRFKRVALLNEGIALSLADDERATETLGKALLKAPDTPEEVDTSRIKYKTSKAKAHFALAQQLQKTLDDPGAMEHLEGCLSRKGEMTWSGINPDHVRLDLAYARMREGIFDERSWLLHESRWFRVPTKKNPPTNFSDPKGKTALIHMEQGMGDNIQFVRFIRILKERGAKTILKARKSLLSLMSRMSFVDQTVDEELPDPPHDLHLHTMSLPHLLGLGGEIGKCSEPYISPDPELAKDWSSRLPDGPKVGIVWKGNPRKGEDQEIQKKMQRRNIPLTDLVASIPDNFKIISLQKDNSEVHPRVHDPMENVADYHDTAAIVENLDLVIGVDTSVIHLAAAMGKPTVMFSRRDACWRWGKDEQTATRWYPSMTMIRQETTGDWEVPLRRLADELGRQKTLLA